MASTSSKDSDNTTIPTDKATSFGGMMLAEDVPCCVIKKVRKVGRIGSSIKSTQSVNKFLMYDGLGKDLTKFCKISGKIGFRKALGQVHKWFPTLEFENKSSHASNRKLPWADNGARGRIQEAKGASGDLVYFAHMYKDFEPLIALQKAHSLDFVMIFELHKALWKERSSKRKAPALKAAKKKAKSSSTSMTSSLDEDIPIFSPQQRKRKNPSLPHSSFVPVLSLIHLPYTILLVPESKHIVDIKELRWEICQLAGDLNSKQEKLNRHKAEVKELKTFHLDSLVNNASHFICSDALKDNLAILCFNMSRLGFKKTLQEVKTRYSDHPLDFASFKRYDVDETNELVTNLGMKFTELRIVEDLFKGVLIEEEKYENDGGDDGEVNSQSVVE
ncbi:hypothetical protein ACH5RR_025872 [Cinchona calisaya]|uniref:Uncharacterized protein n=1 Tax=Cinchona calisaya TaxID=153742 RepID=A0ABD2Z0W2_9GENT